MFRNLHRFHENIPTLADIFYEFIMCVIPTQESVTSVRHLALQLEEIHASKTKSDRSEIRRHKLAERWSIKIIARKRNSYVQNDINMEQMELWGCASKASIAVL